MGIHLPINNDVSNIAIIGCGASAVLILEALINIKKEIKKTLNIYIFEKETSYGRGKAYQSKVNRLILNTAPETMSIKDERPDHFINWLVEKEINPLGDIPRNLYGDYLEESLRKCINEFKKSNHNVIIHNAAIDKIQMGPSHRVKFSGEELLFDHCILATGGKLNIPTGLCEDTQENILSIFDEVKISQINKKSKIAIIGSGQSAIDACISMDFFGIEGFYTLISRGGVLPRVKSQLKNKKALLNKNLSDAMHSKDLASTYNLISELIHWKGDLKNHNIIKPASFRTMELDLQRTSKTIPSWQNVMMSITPHINNAWGRLNYSEKNDFFINYQKSMYHLRSAIMPTSAKRFLEIYNKGRVGMLWGEYAVKKKKNGFHFIKKDASLHFDYIINTSGLTPSSYTEVMNDDIKSGKATVNSFGGVNVDNASMQLIDTSGEINRGFYAIGYPTHGSVLIANSIELLRQSAKKIASNLVKDINKEL